MNLKTGIFSLALGTLLLGSTAMADDNQFQPQWNDNGTEAQAQGFHGGYDSNYRAPIQVHVHTGACRHGPRPTPPQHQQGRYELRTVQQWVAGRYEQVWVPEQCHYKPRRGVTKCRGGYYDQRWVDGHYQNVEQWVWVPSRWHRNSGPEWNSSPASYNY
jgi:hypothetical protein